ncbi:hypothetical protein Pint_30669 [Pistacia integerrima]|uniref:Uncharacterized protein n=1 Tax=Pistacia integerrima TaxID=434235 RepID=A0ACC0X2U5_9ROSI|nr:hypothetical protein Pint_30669 [Pistacia integerrima]
MHRQPDHVMAFLLVELGTSGSLDGQQRLVVKGRFAPKNFERILRRYVIPTRYFRRRIISSFSDVRSVAPDRQLLQSKLVLLPVLAGGMLGPELPPIPVLS